MLKEPTSEKKKNNKVKEPTSEKKKNNKVKEPTSEKILVQLLLGRRPSKRWNFLSRFLRPEGLEKA